jgi:hypothetical protein
MSDTKDTGTSLLSVRVFNHKSLSNDYNEECLKMFDGVHSMAVLHIKKSFELRAVKPTLTF